MWWHTDEAVTVDNTEQKHSWDIFAKTVRHEPFCFYLDCQATTVFNWITVFLINWHKQLFTLHAKKNLVFGYDKSFHAYRDLSTLIQREVKIFNLQSYSFQLGPGEVLKGRMYVMSYNSELNWSFSSTRCSQCVTAASLKVISHSVKGDVVWISIHTAGGRLEREAAFYSIHDLTNFVMCTLHWGALHLIITRAVTLLHTLSFHSCFSFLSINRTCVNTLQHCGSE